MGKDKFEKYCINDMMTAPCGRQTQKYLSRIRKCDIDESWKESPDFLIYDADGMFGIEHFVVDMYHYDIRSGSRVSNDNLNGIYNKHHETLESDIFDAQEACDDINMFIQNEIDLLASFSYNDYISQLYRVFQKHLNKVEKYYANIEEQGKSVEGVIFAVEMRHVINELYSKYYPMRCLRKDGAYVQKRTMEYIPFTNGLVDILKKGIGLLQGVVFLSYGMNGGLTALKYIDLSSESNMHKSMEKQDIEVYNSFDYYFPKGKYNLSIKDE